MVIIRSGLYIVIFLLVGHSVWATGADSLNGPLTLPECIRIALEANPAGRAAAAGVQGAKEALGEAGAPYYPEVGLQAGYRRFQTHAFLPGWVRIPPGSPTVVGPTDDWLGGLRARYTLYDFGERKALWQVASARQGLAEEEAVPDQSGYCLKCALWLLRVDLSLGSQESGGAKPGPQPRSPAPDSPSKGSRRGAEGRCVAGASGGL